MSGNSEQQKTLIETKQIELQNRFDELAKILSLNEKDGKHQEKLGNKLEKKGEEFADVLKNDILTHWDNLPSDSYAAFLKTLDNRTEFADERHMLNSLLICKEVEYKGYAGTPSVDVLLHLIKDLKNPKGPDLAVTLSGSFCTQLIEAQKKNYNPDLNAVIQPLLLKKYLTRSAQFSNLQPNTSNEDLSIRKQAQESFLLAIAFPQIDYSQNSLFVVRDSLGWLNAIMNDKNIHTDIKEKLREDFTEKMITNNSTNMITGLTEKVSSHGTLTEELNEVPTIVSLVKKLQLEMLSSATGGVSRELLLDTIVNRAIEIKEMRGEVPENFKQKQSSLDSYLKQAYDPSLLEDGQWHDAFAKAFDASKTNDTPDDQTTKAQFEKILDAYLFKGKLVKHSGAQYSYSVAPNSVGLDPDIVKSYPDGTRIVSIKTGVDSNGKDLVTSITFGKDIETLKLSKAKDDLAKYSFDTFFHKQDIPNMSFDYFDLKGSKAFSFWLKSDKVNDDQIKTLLESEFFTNVATYSNKYDSSATASYKEGFRTAMVQEVIARAQRAKDDPKNNYLLVQTLMRQLNPQDNIWNPMYLGDTVEAKQANMNLIKLFVKEAGWNKGTDAQKKITTQVVALDSQIFPVNAKENQKGMLQSIVSILKGDFENVNPMVRSIFFMVSEFLGGKNSLLAQLSPKLHDKVNNFYRKEFDLSRDKREVLDSVRTAYANKVSENTTPIKNQVPFNVSFATEILQKDPRFWQQLDPKVLSGILVKHRIQGVVDVQKPQDIPADVQTVILQKIMQDAELFKCIDSTFSQVAKIKDGNYSFANDVVGRQEQYFTAFTTYLLAGSKNHFYNVLTENNLDTSFDLDKSRKEEIVRLYTLPQNFIPVFEQGKYGDCLSYLQKGKTKIPILIQNGVIEEIVGEGKNPMLNIVEKTINLNPS